MERPRNYADPAKTTYIPAGPLTFGIEYRHLQTDQGICIHVFGEGRLASGPKPLSDLVATCEGKLEIRDMKGLHDYAVMFEYHLTGLTPVPSAPPTWAQEW